MKGEAASIECEYDPYTAAYAGVQSGPPLARIMEGHRWLGSVVASETLTRRDQLGLWPRNQLEWCRVEVP